MFVLEFLSFPGVNVTLHRHRKCCFLGSTKSGNTIIILMTL
jgi:hypothetical protein